MKPDTTNPEDRRALRHQIETAARAILMIRGLSEPDPSVVDAVVADIVKIVEEERPLRFEEQLEHLVARVTASLP